MSATIHDFDVLIVGGGPVGCLLALLLSVFSLKIRIIDAITPEQALKKGRDGRTTALSWGSAQILKRIDLWPQLSSFTTPIQEIRISQSLTKGFVHFNQEDAKGHPMGFILENIKLREALIQRIHASAYIDFKTPCLVKSLESTHPSFLSVTLNDGETIRTRLLVGADGSHSQIRNLMGLKTFKASYHQTAIVTSVLHSEPHQNWAFEHFLPSGPLAFLPINTHQSSIVWSLKNEIVSALKKLSEEEFLLKLHRHFPYLGDLKLMSERDYYPLHIHVARTMISNRTALVGDAGHTLHPIAGQGANLGFRDAAILAYLIQESTHLGLDIGSDILLKRYQRRRLKDIVTLASMTDGLVRLFSNSSRFLSFIRGIGMSSIHALPPLRQKLTQHAMGWDIYD